MKFASVKQIVLMVLVVVIILFTVDYFKNPQLWHPPSVVMAGPGIRLTLWMNRLCCTECLDNVRHALDGVSGVDLVNAKGPQSLINQAQADKQMGSVADYGNTVELPVTDLDTLDVVAIDRRLRDNGFVAGRMELSGVEHFRVEVSLDHLCCSMCDRAIPERVSFLKASGQGRLKWIDSVSVQDDTKAVVAYARYLEPGKAVDVGEFLSGLNYLGYEPSSLRIVAEQTPQPMHAHSGE
jgi:hypothetical protein